MVYRVYVEKRPELAQEAAARLQSAIIIGEEKPELPPLIYAAVAPGETVRYA